ncbi:hypothetical protein FHR83_001738 [Actinoplanes campanulatus]|uniref:Uncharacterized protein n=1 Tax=Actinoplanes campanulatus TaxID=113559 RepID=A0A7W5FD59_9ACTN|nr:hypothetical protein [Actinoplanes campanulatus]GGN32911.1 hypothetical protein GCM10010109_54390 [Actinoplanes campanulatus]GID38214.1 hypothetical protein Aca09nite_47200 [Actinoplanes campanulatus]
MVIPATRRRIDHFIRANLRFAMRFAAQICEATALSAVSQISRQREPGVDEALAIATEAPVHLAVVVQGFGCAFLLARYEGV